jgi:hypothetical protein
LANSKHARLDHWARIYIDHVVWDMRTASTRPQRIRLAKTGWTLAIAGCPDVVEGLHRILTGWDLTVEPTTRRRPRARISCDMAGEFVWESYGASEPVMWKTRPPESAMDVLCDIHDVFFDWYLSDNPRHLAVHGAAAHIGDGLVVFPAMTKTGKSTLMVELARRGTTVFCDDVLALEPKRNHGVALGLMPRLRNPLPRRASAAFRAFVAARQGPTDKRWIYATLRAGEIAPFGTTAPIKAFVFLDRMVRGAARIEPVDPGAMLSELIAQNIARGFPAADVFQRFHALVQDGTCYRLSYAATDDAASAMLAQFSARTRTSVRSRRASNRASA